MGLGGREHSVCECVCGEPCGLEYKQRCKRAPGTVGQLWAAEDGHLPLLASTPSMPQSPTKVLHEASAPVWRVTKMTPLTPSGWAGKPQTGSSRLLLHPFLHLQAPHNLIPTNPGSARKPLLT